MENLTQSFYKDVLFVYTDSQFPIQDARGVTTSAGVCFTDGSVSTKTPMEGTAGFLASEKFLQLSKIYANYEVLHVKCEVTHTKIEVTPQAARDGKLVVPEFTRTGLFLGCGVSQFSSFPLPYNKEQFSPTIVSSMQKNIEGSIEIGTSVLEFDKAAYMKSVGMSNLAKTPDPYPPQAALSFLVVAPWTQSVALGTQPFVFTYVFTTKVRFSAPIALDLFRCRSIDRMILFNMCYGKLRDCPNFVYYSDESLEDLYKRAEQHLLKYTNLRALRDQFLKGDSDEKI